MTSSSSSASPTSFSTDTSSFSFFLQSETDASQQNPSSIVQHHVNNSPSRLSSRSESPSRSEQALILSHSRPGSPARSRESSPLSSLSRQEPLQFADQAVIKPFGDGLTALKDVSACEDRGVAALEKWRNLVSELRQTARPAFKKQLDFLIGLSQSISHCPASQQKLIVELEKTLEFSYKVIELMRLKIPAFERLVEIESELRSNTKENIEIQLENVVALRQHLQSQPACVKNFERLNKIENNLENLFILYRKITREQQSRNNQHLAAHRHYLKQDEQFSKIIQNSLSSIKNIEKLQPTFPDMTVIIDKMNKNLGDLIAERQELEAKRTVVMASKDNLAQEEYYQRAVQFKSLCHDLESWQTALISRAT